MPRVPDSTTVYIVRWAEIGVTKVGRTILPSRVRKFVLRGASVERLLHSVPLDAELLLLKRAQAQGAPAFDRWQDAVPFLGAGGTGFSECFLLSDTEHADLLEVVDRAYPQYQA